MAIQDFGLNFDLSKPKFAQSVAKDLTFELSSLIKPGMTETEGHQLYKELCLKYPIEKQWHPPKIRFGPNTTRSFKEVSAPYELKEEDLFFIDIGPVIDGHEADFGQTFFLGSNFEFRRIAEEAERIFLEVRDFWAKEKVTGPALYDYAQRKAQSKGYSLNMYSDGHRIGDFPHHIHFKGGIVECPEQLVPNAWILEIHLMNNAGNFGAFFEDLLTLEA